MADIETELRDAMAAAVAGARPPADVIALVRSGHRRHQLRAAAASAAAVAVVLAAAAAVAAVRGGHSRPEGVGQRPRQPVPRMSPRARRCHLRRLAGFGMRMARVISSTLRAGGTS